MSSKEWSVLITKDMYGSLRLENAEGWVVNLYHDQKASGPSTRGWQHGCDKGHASFHCPMRKMRIPQQRYHGQQTATLQKFYGEQSFWGWDEDLAFTDHHAALDSGPNSGQDQLGSDCSSSFVLNFFSQPAFFCFCWNETQNKTCLTFKLLCWWLTDPLHGFKLATSSLAVSLVPSEKQGNEFLLIMKKWTLIELFPESKLLSKYALTSDPKTRICLWEQLHFHWGQSWITLCLTKGWESLWQSTNCYQGY